MNDRWIDLPRGSAALLFACAAGLAAATADAAPTIRIGKLISTAPEDPPPTDAFCRQTFGVPCYSPQEIRTAYGLNSMIDAGYIGTGQTIVLIESFGSPTLQADLQAFDQGYGLPDPPSLKVLSPLGTVPFDPTNNDQLSWAGETTLDVEWAHAIAPGANIVVLTSPVDETEGVQGLPEFLQLEKYAIDHLHVNVISQSWAATENTLFTPGGQRVMANFSEFYERARDRKVTVLASAGDWGSTGYELDLATLYPFPCVGFPASSPLVTAVGGTTLFADTSGNYQYETVWNDSSFGFVGAGGGGVSQYFAEPDYQQDSLPRNVQNMLGGYRGIPDVSYNADPVSPILIYLSFFGPANAGFYMTGGTSEGSPQWAGIVADLNQYAGHPLGFLNPRLYALGHRGAVSDYIRDITMGNNAIIGVPGITDVPGYNATAGWDLASGWGTPDFVHVPSAWSEMFDQ
jgi:subtilase family serine protease